jgi:hypothetical protein
MKIKNLFKQKNLMEGDRDDYDELVKEIEDENNEMDGSSSELIVEINKNIDTYNEREFQEKVLELFKLWKQNK